MKLKRSSKKTWNIVSWISVYLVLVVAIIFMGGNLAGIKPYSVLSGSMEPTYMTGSVIFVMEKEPEDIKVGDPISFVLDESLTVATHRVVEIDVDQEHFITKGDANDSIDAKPVHFNNLIGIPIYTIPKLGYFVSYIQRPPGKYIAFIMAALLLMLAFVPGLFDEDKDKVKENKKKLKKLKRTTKREEP